MTVTVPETLLKERQPFRLLCMFDMEALGLEQSLCRKLQAIHVNTIQDMKKRDLPVLCHDLELSPNEIIAVYSAVHEDSMPRIYTGLELLQRGQKLKFIPTFCQAFNVLLADNGVPVGKIIEFCGSPGSGKTQLGIQLAINAQLSNKLTSVDIEALYIDTEGGFHIHRAHEIAQSMVDQMQARHTTDPSQLPTARSILSNIHLFRIHSHFELIALVINLPNILEVYPKIRIIIVDTVTFHLRTNIRDLTTKTKIIKSILEQLHKLASSHNVAMVVMNQMTTFKDGNTIIPALGRRWGQNIHCRIQLSEDYKGRHAIRIKPAGRSILRQPFSITSEGIRNGNGDLDQVVDEEAVSKSLISLSSGVADVDIGDMTSVPDTIILNDDENRSIVLTEDILQEATQTYAGHKRHFDAIEDDEQEFSDADVLCFASQDYH